MFVNIQISESTFNTILRDYVQMAVLTHENLGLEGIRDIPFSPLDRTAPSEPGVIDRIEIEAISLAYLRGGDVTRETTTINMPPLAGVGGFGPIPRTATLDIPPLAAFCNIGVYCIRVTDLEAAGLAPAPTSDYVRFGIQAVFTVNQPTIVSNNLLLQFTPVGINVEVLDLFVATDDITNPDVQALGDDLLQLMIDNANEWFPPISFPIGNLGEVFGAGLRVWNAGLRIGGGVIDLQLQVEPSDTVTWLLDSLLAAGWEAQWDAYYSGGLTNRLGIGLDWGVYFPFELFDQRITTTVETALAGRPDVVLNESPRSTWIVTGGAPSGSCFPGGSGSVDTRIAVHLPGACIPWGYDMDVNLRLDTQVSLPRPGVLRLDLRASHEVDPGDAFICGSLNAILIGGAFLTIGGLIGGWVGAVAGGILGGLLGGFGTLGAILAQDLPSLSTAELEPIEGEDNAYFTEIEIEDTENEVLGIIRATQLVPCSDGLVAGGNLSRSGREFQLLPRGALAFPRWRQPGRPECPPESEDPEIIAEIGFHFFRDARDRAVPFVPWGIEYLAEDPAGEWPDPQAYLTTDSMVYRYHFTPDELQQLRDRTTGANPFVKILFQSNAGARILVVPVRADQLTAADLSAVEDEITDTCTANQDLIDSFEERTRHLRDVIRGPIPYLEGINFDVTRWSLAFTGLHLHTKIELTAMMDNKVLGQRAIDLDSQGYGSTELWQRGQLLKADLMLRVAGAGDQEKPKQPGFIVVSRRYRIMDVVSLPGKFEDAALVENRYGVFAAIFSGGRLLSYRLGALGRLYLSNLHFAGNLAGVMSYAGSLLVWGKGGAWAFEGDDGWQHIADTQKDLFAQLNIKRPGKMPNNAQPTTDFEMSAGVSPTIAATSGYALLPGEKGNEAQFMELIDIAVGGYVQDW